MLTLILGGARSGKSEIAESLTAAVGGPVTYIATLRADIDDGSAGDTSLGDRIAAHRARRPADWATVEAGDDLSGLLQSLRGTVLLDSLGPWVAAHRDFVTDTAGVCAALTERSGDTIVVSDEVGLGVVPSTALGGAFRDALGLVNRSVAAVADRVYLAVAGKVLPLIDPPER